MHRWCCPLKHVDFLVPGACSPPQLWHSLEQQKVQETSLLRNKTRISIYKMSFDQSNKESVRTLKSLVFSSPLSGVTRYRLNISSLLSTPSISFQKKHRNPLNLASNGLEIFSASLADCSARSKAAAAGLPGRGWIQWYPCASNKAMIVIIHVLLDVTSPQSFGETFPIYCHSATPKDTSSTSQGLQLPAPLFRLLCRRLPGWDLHPTDAPTSSLRPCQSPQRPLQQLETNPLHAVWAPGRAIARWFSLVSLRKWQAEVVDHTGTIQYNH